MGKKCGGKRVDNLNFPLECLQSQPMVNYKALLRTYTRLLLLAFSLSACYLNGETIAPTVASSAAFIPTATASPLPTVTLAPTATAVPTPITPHLEISPQTIEEDGLITIDLAELPEAGWLAVYSTDNESPGELLGYTAVAPGTHENLTITIDPKAATHTLIAQLYADGSEINTFEHPGPDSPLNADTNISFDVDIQLPIPAITVKDQVVAADGRLQIERAFTEEPAWLVIQTQTADGNDAILGQFPLAIGEHEDINFPIDWLNATTDLLAVLYTDMEQTGGFDPHKDRPLMVNGETVTAVFQVTLPPDLHVYNQPVVNGQFVVSRAVTPEPAWLVVYLEEEGQPGLIIGSAFLEAGINENVIVTIGETAVTDRLFLQLHQDTATLGEFDYPRSDPLLTYNDAYLEPWLMNTAAGNYLITMDQTLDTDNNITVPLTVADLDTWLVIYTTNGNAPDKIIGEIWLPAGVNQNIKVEIDPEQATETLLAVLHQDVATSHIFDYPDGLDVPLQRNRLLIQSPFTLE